MFGKPTYPLTPEAKEAAQRLVEAWDQGVLPQSFEFVEQFTDEGVAGSMILQSDAPISDIAKSTYSELATYGLLLVTDSGGAEYSVIYEVLLLQELRNAVANDFVVSDYFLTMNAVGVFNTGTITMHSGASMNAAASIYGNIEQHTDKLADDLTEVLGDLVKERKELAQAITELRDAEESTFEQRLGNVVKELGNSLGHGANTVTIIQALYTIGRMTGQL